MPLGVIYQLITWAGLLALGVSVKFLQKSAQSFADAYAIEKGKRKAAEEDFHKAVAELRTTTRHVEEVKASVSDDLWVRQRIWQEKRDVYNSILKKVQELSNLAHRLRYAVPSESQSDRLEFYNEGMETLQASELEFGILLWTARLFISDARVDNLFREFFPTAISRDMEDLPIEKRREAFKNFLTTLGNDYAIFGDRLLVLFRSDLGVTNMPPH